MGKLTISSSEDSKYIISGSINDILSNRRALSLLKTKLKINELGDTIIIDSDAPIEKVANLLQLAAKYVNAEILYDDNVEAEIKVFHEQELMFQNFSSKAKDIKENNCIKEEFEEFTNSLSANMKNRTLYELQLLSAYHLAFSQNGCNFSVPGAGKTSIVYGAYTYLKNLNPSNQKKIDKIVIIGPLSAFGPWESEYEECFGYKANCKRINGSISLENKKQYFYGETCELTLISYASVVSVKDALKFYLQNNKVMVVLDEAHKIKNTNGGVISSAIMEIASFCSSRVILTGTPAPNGYEDLYNLFHFIWPNKDVAKYSIGQLRDMSKNPNDSRIPALINNIDPYYIRIKKKDLGITPPIDNPPILIDMSESQHQIYDFIEERFVAEANSIQGNFHSVMIKAKMIRLQQVATNPALLRSSLSEFADENDIDFSSIEAEDKAIMTDIMRFYEDETPAKFIECANLVKNIITNGGKAVVWAIFIKTIDLLANYFDSLGIKSKKLYGATPVASDGMTPDDESYEFTRESIIKEFHKPDCEFKVIIANPFAVAESISLHKACHNAIYLERSFNCSHFIQSKDRIHRYGLPQNTETNYYYLLSKDSIDETIDRRLKEKETRMIELIESSPIPLFDNIGEDADEDIKAIMEDYAKRKAKQI